ncbi:MAG TPA: acetyl-CoA acetyltransferase [Nitriliruptorales bacterium]
MERFDLSRHPIYVTGVAETALGEVHDETTFSMVAKAAAEALGEAGLSFDDVDGVFTNYMGEEGSIQLGEYLGIRHPRYSDSSDLGGGAFEAFVHHAALAIAAGRCEVALIGFASRQRTLRGRSMVHPTGSLSLDAQFQQPYGIPMPIGHYAMFAARHMHQYGTTAEQLAEVAVAANRWAQLNPKAWRHGQVIEVDDVLDSKLIASPLHKLDCCLITDGGGVAIVTDAAHARDAVRPPVRVLGAGESQHQWHLAETEDLTVTPAVVSGREAFGMAGITPADVDVLEPYDAFTINVILVLEDLGFCEKGEGGALVEEGVLRPGGRLPTMTNGGGLSYNHPGAYGLMILIEAVRQLRGEAGDRQVPGAEVGVVQGFGGFFSAAQTLVLGRE